MVNEQYAPPPGPPPRRRPNHPNEYAPPQGPPPSYHSNFAPPTGPPSSHHRQETFAPPSGPPPSRHHDGSFAPPPGPPPKGVRSESSQDPPQNHDWTVIPDTALLPPPPVIHHEVSPTANASETQARQAHEWCHRNPLAPPQNLSPAAQQARRQCQFLINRPREFTGNIFPNRTPGTYRIKAAERCADCILVMALPMYAANLESPSRTRVPKTIYFEVRVERMGTGRSGGEAGIALGFVALPYPTWRLPGWERGSLGVHGDDGRRYMNDTYGGKDFTESFRNGETVGIGIRFGISESPPQYGSGQVQLNGEVFFTRNGQKVGGWDIHEERDQDDETGDAQGLEGFHDLYASLGMFGGSDFQIILNPAEWKHHPYEG